MGARAVSLTADGGFISVGTTVEPATDSSAASVLRLDGLGRVAWHMVFDGAGEDLARSVACAPDGKCVVAGSTSSFGAGEADFWLTSFDASGHVVWQKAYGGAGRDSAWSIQVTEYGGYIVAGTSDSFSEGGLWVVKLDRHGTVLWERSYGPSNSERASIHATRNGGYVVAGETALIRAEGGDVWVLKLDRRGMVDWQIAYSSALSPVSVRSVRQTTAGRYVVGGTSWAYGVGESDFWILELDPSGFAMWQRAFGYPGQDDCLAVRPTADGGVVAVGMIDSWGEGRSSRGPWLLRLDPLGRSLWHRDLFPEGAPSFIEGQAFSIEVLSSGGYIIAGEAESSNVGHYVLRSNAEGDISDPSRGGCELWDGPSMVVTEALTTMTSTSIRPVSTSADVTRMAFVPIEMPITSTFVCGETLE